MRDGAVLTDVAGVKVRVRERAARDVRASVRFVGSHPMFGGVSGGFSAAAADLVSGPCAVCDDVDGADEVATFWQSLGLRVVRCSSEEHDEAMAKVSHLPYVLACVLARLGSDALARDLAGRGFRDVTRLAQFAFDVQGAVVQRNASLPSAIDALVEALLRVRDALTAADEPSLRRALELISRGDGDVGGGSGG
jgi:prephenate dehydrogenase